MSPARPDYTLCVLHHGDLGLTVECLRSSLALDPAPRERILLWNAPPGPRSLLPVELRGPVRIVEAGDNHGFTGGANRGVAAAGDVAAVWLLNNDTCLEPDAALGLLDVLAEHPTVGMVGTAGPSRCVRTETSRR